MPSKVTFEITKGKLGQKTYTFTERTVLVMGRSRECQIVVPSTAEHARVSRFHVRFDISLPYVRMRDFGSRYGTYVNDDLLGKRPSDADADQREMFVSEIVELKDGDRVQLAEEVAFVVRIEAAPLCRDCGAEIPARKKRQAEVEPGVLRCAGCRAKTNIRVPEENTKRCSVCGKPGDFAKRLCDRCRADNRGMLAFLANGVRNAPRTVLPWKMDLPDYEILKEIGPGGYGVVYLARWKQNDSPIALKLMLPQIATDQREREKFRREITNIRALDHPNIVRFLDAGSDNGAYYFAMEYCQHGTVTKWLDRLGRPLTVEEALPLMFQALDGLEYAHHAPIPCYLKSEGQYVEGKGLVHRDFKPDNLLLTGGVLHDGQLPEGYTVKVSDFGLAKAFDKAGMSQLTAMGPAGAAGTPQFMPRWQVIDHLYAKPDVDVWAAAATLYFLLTGEFAKPFDGKRDPWSVALHEKAIPIRKRRADIPAKLAAVIDRALLDHGEPQYRSAAAFKKALGG